MLTVLAEENPYQFQWWFVGRLLGRPAEEQKGKDRGIDGRLYFKDEPKQKATKQIILSVKAGKITSSHVRDLRGVIERESAQGTAMGALLTLNHPTREMIVEAASAGFYHSPWGGRYPRIQLLTAAELLDGKGLSYPAPGQTNMSLRKAGRGAPEVHQGTLPGLVKANAEVKRKKRLAG